MRRAALSEAERGAPRSQRQGGGELSSPGPSRPLPAPPAPHPPPPSAHTHTQRSSRLSPFCTLSPGPTAHGGSYCVWVSLWVSLPEGALLSFPVGARPLGASPSPPAPAPPFMPSAQPLWSPFSLGLPLLSCPPASLNCSIFPSPGCGYIFRRHIPNPTGE